MSINSEMNDAIVALDVAIQRHVVASRHESEARKETIAAMNRVNEAQKRVDDLVASMRKLSPRDSDWNRPRAAQESPA